MLLDLFPDKLPRGYKINQFVRCTVLGAITYNQMARASALAGSPTRTRQAQVNWSIVICPCKTCARTNEQSASEGNRNWRSAAAVIAVSLADNDIRQWQPHASNSLIGQISRHHCTRVAYSFILRQIKVQEMGASKWMSIKQLVTATTERQPPLL